MPINQEIKDEIWYDCNRLLVAAAMCSFSLGGITAFGSVWFWMKQGFWPSNTLALWSQHFTGRMPSVYFPEWLGISNLINSLLFQECLMLFFVTIPLFICALFLMAVGIRFSNR